MLIRWLRARRAGWSGAPGNYILAIDLVQEGRTWFRDAGSPTLDIPYRVEG